MSLEEYERYAEGVRTEAPQAGGFFTIPYYFFTQTGLLFRRDFVDLHRNRYTMLYGLAKHFDDCTDGAAAGRLAAAADRLRAQSAAKR